MSPGQNGKGEDWKPWRYRDGRFASIDTSAGAFDQCKVVSAEFTRTMQESGDQAEWVQVCGATVDYEHADPRWSEIPRDHWQHYVTRLVDRDGSVLYVDWTHRQFDPDSPWPLVETAAEFEQRWTDTYDLPDDVLDRYLSRAGVLRS